MAERKTTAAAVEHDDAYYLEPVTIRLFKDSGKYKDDAHVGYNGKFYVIQRGVEVQVPRAVANILMNSENQDAQTAILIEKESSGYRERSQQLN